MDRRARPAQFTALLEGEFEAGDATICPTRPTGSKAAGRGSAGPTSRCLAGATSTPRSTMRSSTSVGEMLTTVPADLADPQDAAAASSTPRRRCSTAATGFDWATAEALAFGTLIAEDGYRVRLSGQDSGRGTFSQRHAVWVDQTDRRQIYPAARRSRRTAAAFEVRDSPLSRIRRARLRIWLFDRRPARRWCCGRRSSAISSTARRPSSTSSSPRGEAKWLRASGLVMLLPHGFEGQGPEHSSARLERFLQLCAEDNIQVANCTTPANYFHILRRQMHRDFRKPLIMMTPKSLLRHKLAVSSSADFVGESHFKRILSDLNPPAEGETTRLVLCSGKIGYELMEARDAAGRPRRPRSAHRAALSLPVRAVGQAAEGDAEPDRTGLGAGRAEEQWRLELRRAAARMLPRRGRASRACGRAMPGATPRRRPRPGLPSATSPSRPR